MKMEIENLRIHRNQSIMKIEMEYHRIQLDPPIMKMEIENLRIQLDPPKQAGGATKIPYTRPPQKIPHR
jgi:hypothetical protein